jgi:membrane peptidoglycan carboxypeptidase
MDLQKKIHDKYKHAVERRGSKVGGHQEKPITASSLLTSIKSKAETLRAFAGGGKKGWTPRRVIAWIITLGIAGAAIGTFLFFASIAILSIGLPSVDNIGATTAQATQIYDRNGTLLYEIYGDQNREYIPYEKISPYLINATIGIEDNQFWEHKGFDMTGLAAAGLHEVFGIGQARGGSTITQQYVKLAFLTPEHSITRKIRELILSVRLEQKYDKQKILELYLNQIPYGNNTYGIQKAAQMYFGKDASALNLGESAILAGIPQLPTYYNPYGAHRYSTLTKNFTSEELGKRNIKTVADVKDTEYSYGLIGKMNALDDKTQVYLPGRADLIIKRMSELGLITSAEKAEATKQIQAVTFIPYKYSIKAPHFVFFVREYLEQKYGKELIERGGLKVYTTLDYNLQQIAENVIATRGITNEKTYKATNAAALFADPKTGQILTMVGSRDYFNDDIDGKVNVVLRSRQPGSSFKPFVYAEAFLKRFSPATVLYDTPLKIGPDTPQNYDGTFHGPMSIRSALGQSRNIPAIKAYFLDGQQGPIIDLATKLGITTLDQNHDYGYPLAIGAGEVRMIDMVTAYSVFANMGKKPELTPILKVTDASGKTIEEWDPNSVNTWQDALYPEVSYLIDSILSDTSVKVSQTLTIDGHTVATKTGTSTNQSKSKGTASPMDLWVMGYTPSIVGSVWVGNNRGTPLGNNADGANVAAPIWKEIMSAFLKDKPDEPFVRPDGVKDVTISTLTGLLPGENTPTDKLRAEVFASFAVPTEVESSFTKVDVDTRNNLLANEFCPPEFVESRNYQTHSDPVDNPAWQDGVNQWYDGTKDKNDPNSTPAGFPPATISPLCIKDQLDKAPIVNITAPAAYEIIAGSTINVAIKFKAPSGAKDVTYYFDNVARAVKSSAPFDEAVVKIPKYAKPGTEYTIKVVVRDKNGYSGEASIQIKTAGTSPDSQTGTGPITPIETPISGSPANQ